MEKRYQVFISSTFQDLQNARQELSQALLRANCFPAGMELFPAADEEQFEFIKTIIDQSDYYIIISAGRYGTIHPETGLSYTEMEYDYAVETGKPVIRLLHRDPFNELRGEFIERTDEGRAKLAAFGENLKTGKMVRFWEDASQLMAETVFGLQDIQKRHPATGWVRADGRATSEVELELAQAKQKVMELEGSEYVPVIDRSKTNHALAISDEAVRLLKATYRKINYVRNDDLKAALLAGLPSSNAAGTVSFKEFITRVKGSLTSKDSSFFSATLTGTSDSQSSDPFPYEQAVKLIDGLVMLGILQEITPSNFHLGEFGDGVVRALRSGDLLKTPPQSAP